MLGVFLIRPYSFQGFQFSIVPVAHSAFQWLNYVWDEGNHSSLDAGLLAAQKVEVKDFP
jgi:hypothetical protein